VSAVGPDELMPSAPPAPRRLLAIDHGAARLGLAISDPDRKIASPLATYTRRDQAKDLAHLRRVIEEEEVGGVVVGLPLHTDGRESQQSAAARAFGAWLGKETNLPVVFYDERFSTLFAERELWDAGLTHRRRKERRDRVAAQMILQAYIEAGCPTESL
jgi:putative Holliday junction resolvase